MLGDLTEPQMEALLRAQAVGRLGCYGNGDIYVVPVSYAYERRAIYGHTHNGLKVQLMRQHRRVCFEVDHVEDLANWQSVVAWGIVEELKGSAAEEAVDLLVDRLTPLLRNSPSIPAHALNPLTRRRTDTHGHRSVIYRLVIDTMTGRYEKSS